MAASGLNGPYGLNSIEIDAKVARATGAYALGYINAADDFVIDYVGRSDGDLNARLKSHVGKYPRFKFLLFGTQQAAFEKECNLFHDFGGTALDNKVHPDRPAGMNYRCPRCRIFG